MYHVRSRHESLHAVRVSSSPWHATAEAAADNDARQGRQHPPFSAQVAASATTEGGFFPVYRVVGTILPTMTQVLGIWLWRQR